MDIFAHRGASMYAPENTMSAFQLAYEQGAEGIEIDVHLSKDGVPVLIHDERVNRTTNGQGFVHDYTYKELKQLNAGSWFSAKFSQESIISLDTFLQWIKSKKLALNIELKNNNIYYDSLEKTVYQLLIKYNMLKTTILSTFNIDSIKKITSFSNVNTALVQSRRRRNLVSFAKNLGVNAIHIHYRLLTKKLMRQTDKENLAVRVFTVNNKRRIQGCIRNHCDGIFTNAPDKCIFYRNRLN